jgi:hypothetical protein
MTQNLKPGKVRVKAYCDPTNENMGLENYNYVVFPNTFQVESLAAVEQNGKVIYLTGLNEFAPFVKSIKDEQKRTAVIKDIRETVALLERERGFNDIKTDDKDFWAKVQTFKSDNAEVFGTMNLRLGNDDLILDTQNLDHVLIIKAIEGGGFSLVASSYEDARRFGKKWYLDRQIDTVASKISVTKLRNKALSILASISDDNPRKLYYIAKNADGNSIQYNNRTLADVVYDNMDKFINGLGHEGDKKRAAQFFIDLSELSNEELKLKAVIKDAIYYKFIASKSDGVLYEVSKNVIMGRNSAEVLEFLKNPGNDDLLDTLLAKVEDVWSK